VIHRSAEYRQSSSGWDKWACSIVHPSVDAEEICNGTVALRIREQACVGTWRPIDEPDLQTGIARVWTHMQVPQQPYLQPYRKRAVEVAWEPVYGGNSFRHSEQNTFRFMRDPTKPIRQSRVPQTSVFLSVHVILYHLNFQSSVPNRSHVSFLYTTRSLDSKHRMGGWCARSSRTFCDRLVLPCWMSS
jgi:hypothetical protein